MIGVILYKDFEASMIGGNEGIISTIVEKRYKTRNHANQIEVFVKKRSRL